MATYNTFKGQLLSFYLFSCVISLSLASKLNPSFRIKSVNLGGWLVTEGWMTPSLFDGIPNKDLLDGTQIQLRSIKNGKYLSAEIGGGSIIVANRANASYWETFRLWRINETTFNMRVFHRQFMGLHNRGNGIDIVAVSYKPGRSETLQIVKKSSDSNLVRIKASNGLFLQVKTEELVTADLNGNGGEWGDHDPSVFEMTIVAGLQGEFQVTNGYGPDKAPQVMKEHWNTFIVEEDFKFLSENGLNAVRIPVGWWIASDPMPPKPYVGGSLQVLDNAFSWAKKYGLMVMIDLHAAPGGQSVYAHCSTRDGYMDWGETDENIEETVAVIDFLTARYAKHPSLVGVQLLNEPLITGVSLKSLNKYYKAGYDAVRKHSSTAYVMFANRLGAPDQRELFPLASGLNGSVIDVHYYNLFWNVFDNMTIQQNIDFIRVNRSSELNHLINTPDGPLIFVGEWVVDWEVKGATKEDYMRFAKVQLDVWAQATFGWAYWGLKCVKKHWDMEWMIKNGYIKL